MKHAALLGRRRSSINRHVVGSKAERGFALVSALLLVVVVGIVAATVLQTTSTEIKISGHQRQAVQDFYAAEAGLAEAQVRLRNHPGAEQFFISDLGPTVNSLWSSYILTSPQWVPTDDPNFSAHYLNLIPQPGNPTSTSIQPNSLQGSLPYWVKIRHKTEYDAEQAGHGPSTPHYLDGDGSLSQHQPAHVGNVLYYGYPTREATEPEALTTQGPSPWLAVEMVTSHGGNGSGGVLLEAEVVHPVGPNHLGAIYSTDDVTLSGQSGTIDGHDACRVAPSLPPVYAGGLVNAGGGVQLAGNPNIPFQGSAGFDLWQISAELSRGAIVVEPNLLSQQLGAPGAMAMTYVIPGTNQTPIFLRNVHGRGILLVQGPAILDGVVSWEGMMIVAGELSIQGDGAVMTLSGGLWVHALRQTGGRLNIHYDSCLIKSALLSQPLQVRTWREISSGF